jgi:hypothetical protein
LNRESYSPVHSRLFPKVNLNFVQSHRCAWIPGLIHEFNRFRCENEKLTFWGKNNDWTGFTFAMKDGIGRHLEAYALRKILLGMLPNFSKIAFQGRTRRGPLLLNSTGFSQVKTGFHVTLYLEM